MSAPKYFDIYYLFIIDSLSRHLKLYCFVVSGQTSHARTLCMNQNSYTLYLFIDCKNFQCYEGETARKKLINYFFDITAIFSYKKVFFN